MIMEIITSDFKNKCANCKYFKTDNGLDGTCINTENKIKSYNRIRYCNSKACAYKEKRIKKMENFKFCRKCNQAFFGNSDETLCSKCEADLEKKYDDEYEDVYEEEYFCNRCGQPIDYWEYESNIEGYCEDCYEEMLEDDYDEDGE